MEERISFYSRSTRHFLFDVWDIRDLTIEENNNNVSAALCSGERDPSAGFRMDICRGSLRKSTNESNAKMHKFNPVIRGIEPIPDYRKVKRREYEPLDSSA
jgi:hypothetical protein